MEENLVLQKIKEYLNSLIDGDRTNGYGIRVGHILDVIDEMEKQYGKQTKSK